MEQIRLLIGCSTHKYKDYCQESFFKNLIYGVHEADPKYTVDYIVVDNSEDLANTHQLHRIFDKYGQTAHIEHDVWHYDPKWRLASSNNRIRQYALEKGYTHLLNIESDIFPKNFDFLHTWTKYPVITACYKLYNPEWMPTATDKDKATGVNSVWFKRRNLYKNKFYTRWADDTWIKEKPIRELTIEVAGYGIGLVMMHTDVLKQMYWHSHAAPPDSHFKEQLEVCGVRSYLDNTVEIFHDARNWDEVVRQDMNYVNQTFTVRGEKFTELKEERK